MNLSFFHYITCQFLIFLIKIYLSDILIIILRRLFYIRINLVRILLLFCIFCLHELFQIIHNKHLYFAFLIIKDKLKESFFYVNYKLNKLI